MPTGTEMKIAVVDDTARDCMQIKSMAEQILHQSNISHSITCFDNGKALLDRILSGEKYNLLLLDVLMDGMDGMELAQTLRGQGDPVMIVFVSSCQEMARRGYIMEASRYLFKPLVQEELKEALLHCHKKWQAKQEILLPTFKGQYRTSYPDIQFVEAFDRGTRFILSDRTVETKLKFSEAEAMLPPSMFVVCHRAYIVNLARAKYIRQHEFTMIDGTVVPISRLRYNNINQKFVEYFTN